MKIEKITDTFVNEFDAQAQSCSDDCEEYRGKTEDTIKGQYPEERESYEFDLADCKNVKSKGHTYCYREYTAKTTIYW